MDRNVELERSGFNRGGSQLLSAARGPIRLRYDARDLRATRKRLQARNRERARTKEKRFHEPALRRRGFRDLFFVFSLRLAHVGRFIDIEDAVEMIDFML